MSADPLGLAGIGIVAVDEGEDAPNTEQSSKLPEKSALIN
jgi:hypothetical protein